MHFACRGAMTAVLLSVVACANQQVEKTYQSESGQQVNFVGVEDNRLFSTGLARFTRPNGTLVFEGQFDDSGYPASGAMTIPLGEGGGYQLRLEGKFVVHQAQQTMEFDGAFQIIDGENRLVLEGAESRWQADYPEFHPYASAHNFVLVGKNRYRQHRRKLPSALNALGLTDIHRPLAGPFVVANKVLEGRPRGMIKITAENLNNQAYVVERQYHNDQLKPPIHYFYYEPGSFSQIDILGDCERAPNLTVPQDLMEAFAYDCQARHFLALSPLFPASVVQVRAQDLDNSGSFRKLKVLHHGNETTMEIDPAMLFEGELAPDGVVVKRHYGKIQSYQHFLQGHAVGIGLEVSDGNPRYSRSVWPEAPVRLPSAALVSRLRQSYVERRSTLENISESLAQRILSAEELASFSASLDGMIDSDVEETELQNIPGLLALQQRWQFESRGQVKAWVQSNQGNKGRDLKRLRNSLLAGLDEWWQDSLEILVEQGRQACAAAGQSFDETRAICVDRPDAQTAKICQRYYGAQRCEEMANALRP